MMPLYTDTDTDSDSDVTVLTAQVKRMDMMVGIDLQGNNKLGIMIVGQARTCLNDLITTYF